MEAVQYVKSVPRYLLARYGGPRWNAVYTSGLSTVKFADLEPPALPSARWLRIRPLLSGICGSDLATVTASGTAYFSPFTSTPFVFGHEVVATVEQEAPGCGLKAGDRVVLEPPLHCEIREIDPPCRACSEGRTVHCRNINAGVVAAGIQSGFCRDTGGGWSEGMVAHGRQLHRVPDRLSDEIAVLVEPLSCCLHAVKKVSMEEGDTAVIQGCGTMGLLTLLAARALHPRTRLVAIAKYDHQHRIAARLGADEVVSHSIGLAELAELLGGMAYQPELGRPSVLGGAAVFFNCLGSSRSIDDAMRLTRAGGRIIMVGMPSLPKGVDWTAMWHKELDIQGSYTSEPATFREALGLAEASAHQLRDFVGARFPLHEYRRAIRTALQSGREGVVKVAFEIPG